MPTITPDYVQLLNLAQLFAGCRCCATAWGDPSDIHPGKGANDLRRRYAASADAWGLCWSNVLTKLPFHQGMPVFCAPIARALEDAERIEEEWGAAALTENIAAEIADIVHWHPESPLHARDPFTILAHLPHQLRSHDADASA